MKKRHFGSWALGAALFFFCTILLLGIGAHDGGPLFLGYILSVLLAVPLTIVDVVRFRDTQAWFSLAAAIGIVFLYQ